MNIAPAIASANVRKSASLHRSSSRSSASSVCVLILANIRNLACSCVSFALQLEGGRHLACPSEPNDMPASGRYGSRDLVERRVCDIKGLNLRGSLDYRCEELRHFRVRSAVVSLGTL